jgi:hypothetical protein
MIEVSTNGTWPAWLTRRELSEYLRAVHGVRLSISALAGMACRGDGPRFTKDGRLTSYPRSEVDAWAEKRRSPVVRSVSELKRIRAQAVDLQEVAG